MPLNLGTSRFTYRSASPAKEVSPRSRRVRISRNMLAIMAVLLFIAIVIIAWFNSGDSNRLVLSGSNKPSEAGANMLRPRYHGVDSQNRPYTIMADVATQQTDGSILLERINADMMVKDTAWLALNAQNGRLMPEAQQVELTQNIQMFYEGGYEFRSNHALINMKTATVIGKEPIEGQGPSGIIKANRFEILESGEVLKFMENVRVTLYVD